MINLENQQTAFNKDSNKIFFSFPRLIPISKVSLNNQRHIKNCVCVCTFVVEYRNQVRIIAPRQEKW